MWYQFTLVAGLSSTPLSLWLLYTGYVSTILNRRRWLPHIKSCDFTQRSQAERQAVNFIVQGLCICGYNYFHWTLFCNVCKVYLKVHKVSPPNSPWILSLNPKLTFPLWECTFLKFENTFHPFESLGHLTSLVHSYWLNYLTTWVQIAFKPVSEDVSSFFLNKPISHWFVTLFDFKVLPPIYVKQRWFRS